ncbi:MAG TPA: MAPEG family protein [Candidatus Binatia bacterium]|nr:MAPEG family protein [Candidatus Binatia bacterium]
MQEWLVPYTPSIWAAGTTAMLLIAQIVVLDVAGIRAGHVPGAGVVADHGNFFFRAVRAHANTNESIAAFILVLAFAVLTAATPRWVNGLAWMYVLARTAHMLCYYADARIPRSICFVAGTLAIVGLFVVAAIGL